MTKAERWAVVVGVTVTGGAVLLGAGTVRLIEVIAIAVAVVAFIGTMLVLGKREE